MNKELTFKKVKQEFLNSLKVVRKKSTIDQYNKLLNREFYYLINDLDMRTINKNILNEFKKKINNLNCQIEYKKSHINLILKIYNYAKNKYKINNKAFENLRNFYTNPNQIKILKENDICLIDDFNLYITCLDNEINKITTKENKIKYIQLKIISLLCYYSGLRIGEALTLKVNDIKRRNKQYFLQVNKTLYEYSISKSKFILKSTSTKSKSSNRSIPLPSFLISYLLKIIKKYKLKENYYFSSFNSKLKYSSNSFRKRMNRIQVKYKLTKYHFHSFRHSFATILVNNNESIETVSKLLGHYSTITTFNTYYHLLADTAILAINKFEKVSSLSNK